jgi:hypothetical protein
MVYKGIAEQQRFLAGKSNVFAHRTQPILPNEILLLPQ